MPRLWISLFGMYYILNVSSSVYAGISATQEVAASVGPINTVSLTELGSILPEINSKPVTDFTICYLTLTNNNPTGFKLTLSSQTSGKLIRSVSGSYADTTKHGNWIDYYVSLVGGTGTLGTNEPSLPSDEILSTAHHIFFNTQVERSTLNKVYELKVSMSPKSTLFRGIFRDTITVTISDI